MFFRFLCQTTYAGAPPMYRHFSECETRTESLEDFILKHLEFSDLDRQKLYLESSWLLKRIFYLLHMSTATDLLYFISSSYHSSLTLIRKEVQPRSQGLSSLPLSTTKEAEKRAPGDEVGSRSFCPNGKPVRPK